MRLNKNVLYGALLLAAAMISGVGYVFFYYYPSLEQLEAADARAAISGRRLVSALDGSTVKSKADVQPRVVAVMIDNHPDARPEYGLAKAKVVYEAPVEGEFTRYMAVYDSKQNISQAGPVRSARPYYLDWLQEYGNALYMHSGGSPEALDLIDSLKISDANEFYWGSYYWRMPEKDAPHNLFTNSDNWQKLLSKAGATSTFAAANSWKYASILGRSISLKKEIAITYAPSYQVVWKYDPKALNFVRYINGEKELDADGAEIRARNILVQYVAVQVIDDEGRKAITTIGGGDALIARKGELIHGSWKKQAQASRTRFYNQQNKEIVLVPGNTWVEIVPENAKVDVTN